MNQKDVSRMEIFIGDHNVYSTSDGPHEYDDVAVIRLSKPVTFGKYIQPVCLHTGAPRYDGGTTGADVTGWGQTAEKGKLSFVLNTVNVRVITNTECMQAYGKKAPAGIISNMVGDKEVCAGGKGRDSCKGDSGGPLTIDSHSHAKQIGIVSWGIGCATYPGV
ncbi:Venom protease [Folsomia candida]|uniref:Venom protease n=1 Tax=Folsomia candida TaxID=158441 RepID=A0A226DDL1_FOLCA|nr:Venom protease [Folsomia candida]